MESQLEKLSVLGLFRASNDELDLKLDKRGTDMKRECFAKQKFFLVPMIIALAAIWPQLSRSQPTGMQPEAEKLLRRMSEYLSLL